jgi:hypothetical protein
MIGNLINRWALIGGTLLLAGISQMAVAEDDSLTLEQENCCIEDRQPCYLEKLPTLKFRIGAFLPTSERFCEIYGSSMPVYQFEGIWTFRECYKLWANVDWLDVDGKSDHLEYHTSIQISNFSFGISIPHQINEDLTIYAGLGPSIGWIAVHNKRTKEHRFERQGALGLLCKAELVYDLSSRVFLDIFVDYLYQPAIFRTHVNVGGLKTGGGIGYRF